MNNMSATSLGKHEVFLESPGDNRIAVMAALRRRLSSSPLEVKRLLDAPSAPIFAGSALQVSDWVDELQGLGARVIVRPELPLIPLWRRRAPRDRSRAHHYEFAHVAVVTFFRQNASDLWSLLSAEGAGVWLHRIWSRIGEALPAEERVEDTGLSVVIDKLGHLELAVITLPPPLARVEAYFVALVRSPPQQVATSGFFRYMTLERGVDMSTGGDKTYLCEWTVDNHVNHGDGPPPTIEAFLQAIAELEPSKPTTSAGAPLATPDSSAIRGMKSTRGAQRRSATPAGVSGASRSSATPALEERPRRVAALKPITVVLILLVIAALVIVVLSR